MLPAGGDFPFNEEILIADGMNRNSAVIGGIKYWDVRVYLYIISFIYECMVSLFCVFYIVITFNSISLDISISSVFDLGIIAVVIFTTFCILAFLIRYVFRHKGTYHTNESKEAKRSESADTAIIASEPIFTETIDENKKEWFI